MPSYTKTLEDAQNDLSLQQVCGCGSKTPQFTALINEVGESLANRGSWFDLEQRINFCLTGCDIVWPDFVGTVLGIRYCGGMALMQNQWYSFVNNDYGNQWGSAYSGGIGAGYSGGDGYGSSGYGYGTSAGRRCVVEDNGTRPCYNEITGTTGKLIQYSVVLAADIGKTITLFGTKYGGQPLQEFTPPTWQNGVTLTAAKPYVQSLDLVTQITSITRDATSGVAYLYEYDTSTGLLRDLATFQPGETNPRYRCSTIINPFPGKQDPTTGICYQSIEALIKLKFIPAVNPRDFLPISNFRALKLGIQAVKLEQANQDDDAAKKWVLAVEELLLEQDDKQPKRQVPIRINLGRTISSPI